MLSQRSSQRNPTASVRAHRPYSGLDGNKPAAHSFEIERSPRTDKRMPFARSMQRSLD